MRTDFRFLQFFNLYPLSRSVETDRQAASESKQRREMSKSRPPVVITGPVLSYDDARISRREHRLEQRGGALQHLIGFLRRAGTSTEVKSKANRPAIEKECIQTQSREIITAVSDQV